MAATNVLTIATKTASDSASGGAGEKKLLSPHWNNALPFPQAGQSFHIGDMFRVYAWGYYNSGAGTSNTGQVRLYFDPTGGTTTPIANSVKGTTYPNLDTNLSNIEWHFRALITVASLGAQTGRAYCDSFLENMNDPGVFNMQCGLGGFALDTTQGNTFELTAAVSNNGTFVCTRCSIEYLQSP
jgi:hypothetical protein